MSAIPRVAPRMTVGILYGPGAETLIFVTGTSGKYANIFVSRQKIQSQLWIPGKPRKVGVWVSGAEIQTSAVDTRTAVWVSTAEKISKIFLGETRKFSQKFARGVSAPALYKNPAVIECPGIPRVAPRMPFSLQEFFCKIGRLLINKFR